MFRDLRKNNKGVVFVTVLMIIIVMAVLTVSIISLNVNQSMLTEGEAKRMNAETLALGGLAVMLANQQSARPKNYITYLNLIDGISYNVQINLAGAGLPGTGTSALNISVTY